MHRLPRARLAAVGSRSSPHGQVGRAIPGRMPSAGGSLPAVVVAQAAVVLALGILQVPLFTYALYTAALLAALLAAVAGLRATRPGPDGSDASVSASRLRHGAHDASRHIRAA